MVAQPHKKAVVTRHAMERAMLRLGCATPGAAVRHLQAAWARAVKLPERYGRQLAKRMQDKPHKGRRVQWRVAGSTLLVCRGTRIITTWRLDENQLATVLWFVAANRWEIT